MIELKITGEKPEEFYGHCVRTLVLLLRPPQTQPAPVADQPVEQVTTVVADDQKKVVEAEPLANPSATAAPPEGEPVAVTKKRGRKPATETTAPATVHDDPIPDFLAPEATPVAKISEAVIPKTWTIDDCRDALRHVFANFEQRARAKVENYGSLKGAALTEVENKIMREKVEYAKPLIYDFGVQKVGDLKPEQYASFMENSKPYVSGEK